MFDRKNMKLIAAALAWPVIPLCGWLGLYLFGAVGAVLGTLIGLAVYLTGIFRAVPR